MTFLRSGILPPNYSARDIRRDALAALVVTAIAVPESIGFAALVGLPLETGLYTALFAPIVFALFASSRRLIVGADSATASLIAALSMIVMTSTIPHPIAIAALTILSGLVLLLLSAFKFGFIADLISKPVLIGFFAGVGIQLMLHRLPDMLGISVSGGSTLQLLQGIYAEWSFIDIPTLFVASIVLACAFLIPARYPRLLIGLVAASAVTVIMQLEEYGVALIGALPSGLPPLSVPVIPVDFLVLLLPTALAIALVVIAQSSAVIRSQATEHDEQVDLNTDIRALGLANIVSGISQGFTVNGSPPRTLAADASGGKSQMVNVFMALFVGIVLLIGSGLFAFVPVAALSSVVFAIGVHLIRLNDMRRIIATHQIEFAIMMLTLLSVSAFGVQQGLLIAVIASLAERIRRQYHPSDQILLRDGTLSEWGKERIGKNAHELRKPGLLVYAFDGSLFFENVEYFIGRVMKAVRNAKEPVDTVIIDTGAIEAIDYTAFDGLRRLHQQLKADNIALGLAHVSPPLRTELNRYGIDQLIGKDSIYPTVSSVMKQQSRKNVSAIELIKRLELPSDEYVVIGGAVLESLNLRQTHDIDLVVSERIYRKFQKRPDWKEFVHDDGKKVISHNGYHMMQTWMGRKLTTLQQDAQVIDGVPHMSVKQLIACKQRLGRKKDMADILLLEKARTQTK